MRIDAYNLAANDVSNDPSLLQTGAQKVTHSADAGEQDRTTLQSDSASTTSLAKIALNSPEVRQNKVESLTQAIQNGQYQLDPAKIASAMLDDYA
jgi:negative regulator of flagellin synthesis FlgM